MIEIIIGLMLFVMGLVFGKATKEKLLNSYICLAVVLPFVLYSLKLMIYVQTHTNILELLPILTDYTFLFVDFVLKIALPWYFGFFMGSAVIEMGR